MSDGTARVFFAAVGDVHGHMHAMVRILSGWESKCGEQIAFVLQVGDFEPHRHDEDLATMAAPEKYMKLGEFPDYHSGRAVFPWPIYFIGGNHEPYGLLDRMAGGGEVITNCHFIGRAGTIELEGLRIAGLSGIYIEELFAGRPAIEEIGSRSKEEYIGFTKNDIDQLTDAGCVDVLVLHEWPTGVISVGDHAAFEAQRLHMGYTDVVGNKYARLLIDVLTPKLALCGHMHRPYRNTIKLHNNADCSICCLANVEQGKDAVAIFELSANKLPIHIWP